MLDDVHLLAQLRTVFERSLSNTKPFINEEGIVVSGVFKNSETPAVPVKLPGSGLAASFAEEHKIIVEA